MELRSIHTWCQPIHCKPVLPILQCWSKHLLHKEHIYLNNNNHHKKKKKKIYIYREEESNHVFTPIERGLEVKWLQSIIPESTLKPANNPRYTSTLITWPFPCTLFSLTLFSFSKENKEKHISSRLCDGEHTKMQTHVNEPSSYVTTALVIDVVKEKEK